MDLGGFKWILEGISPVLPGEVQVDFERFKWILGGSGGFWEEFPPGKGSGQRWNPHPLCKKQGMIGTVERFGLGQ